MWPVRPLNELAAVPDQPLKMPLRFLAGLDVQRVRKDRFGAHAEPYGTAGELLPQPPPGGAPLSCGLGAERGVWSKEGSKARDRRYQGGSKLPVFIAE